jgi:hypothetical protein
MNRDEKNRLFESWYQAYIKSHDVGNPAKYKEFARWAFWAGVEAAQPSVQSDDGRHCECSEVLDRDGMCPDIANDKTHRR